jgi:Phosphoenolpyruvate-dependent sugar phosphotransferase system, EIIA 2
MADVDQQTSVDIADFVTPRAVVAQLRAPTKRQVLQELARRAATMTGIADKRIYDALAERERLGTTGIGSGVTACSLASNGRWRSKRSTTSRSTSSSCCWRRPRPAPST